METNKIINGKLLEFQTSIETIKKDGKNTFFKRPDGKASTYATLPNILAEVKPILNALNLIVTQPILENVVMTVITDSVSGETIQSGIALPQGLNAQQIGSAVTYFRRYTLSSLLALEIDEDDDGNKASQKPKENTELKPKMDSETFTKALEAVNKGTSGAYDKATEKYELTSTQLGVLKKAHGIALDKEFSKSN